MTVTDRTAQRAALFAAVAREADRLTEAIDPAAMPHDGEGFYARVLDALGGIDGEEEFAEAAAWLVLWAEHRAEEARNQ
jgi:hypothetical protein